MHRLFVAIRPPPEVRASLISSMGGIAGARWQNDNQLHITLRFIGEVDARRADDLLHALRTVQFDPFSIAVSGLGQFGKKGRAETLWAALQPRDDLLRLHHKVDRACLLAGLPADNRSYLPHITLARLGRDVGSIDPFTACHAGLSSPAFMVDRFMLFESELTRAGAIYHVAAVYEAAEGR